MQIADLERRIDGRRAELHVALGIADAGRALTLRQAIAELDAAQHELAGLRLRNFGLAIRPEGVGGGKQAPVSECLYPPSHTTWGTHD